MPQPDVSVEALFLQSYGHLSTLALEDQRITPADVDSIITGLARHLPSYQGSRTIEPFQEWAGEIIKPAVFLHGLMRECRPYVRGAIRKTFGTDYRFDDLEALVDELEADVWLKVLQKLPAYQKAGPAKMTTRLWRQAYWIARARLTRHLRDHAAVERRLKQGRGFHAEYLSDLELSEMQAETVAA